MREIEHSALRIFSGEAGPSGEADAGEVSEIHLF